MTQEVLKLAENYAKNRANYHIESLYGTNESYTATIKKAMLEAHQALKETLAQTQEPVAWWNDTGTHIDLNVSGRGTPLYTHPPQRTWVGLDEVEIVGCTCECIDVGEFNMSCAIDFARAIEAKLKELNT